MNVATVIGNSLCRCIINVRLRWFRRTFLHSIRESCKVESAMCAVHPQQETLATPMARSLWFANEGNDVSELTLCGRQVWMEFGDVSYFTRFYHVSYLSVTLALT